MNPFKEGKYEDVSLLPQILNEATICVNPMVIIKPEVSID